MELVVGGSMKRVLLFGAGKFAQKWLQYIKGDICVVAIADNAYREIKTCGGHLVIAPHDIMNYEFDELIITLDDLKVGNDAKIINIYAQLIEMGIDDDKIMLQNLKYYIENIFHRPRTNYIYSLAEYFNNVGLKGAIAECGVYRGWFSGILSDAFVSEKLYLFDSFEGFSSSDLELESPKAKEWVNNGAQKRLSNISQEIVKLRIRNRVRMVMRKGFVPQTFENINDSFLFVNLDMDLYVPQIEALRWFAPRMQKGGVILMHDYFNSSLCGTKKAIEDFNGKEFFSIMPIGDLRSIALIRK